MSKGLNYIGIARKSGSIETGEENTAMLVKGGKAKLVIVAADTSPNAKKRAEGYVFSGSTDKSSRNDLAKIHHDLVDFSSLTEEEKGKIVMLVRNNSNHM